MRVNTGSKTEANKMQLTLNILKIPG